MTSKLKLCLFTLLITVSIIVNAETKVDSLKALLKIENESIKKVQLLNNLAIELKEDNLPEAFNFVNQAILITKTENLSNFIGVSQSILGLLYSYLDNKLDSAIYWNKKAIPLLLPFADSLEISRNYNRLGSDYVLKTDFQSAVPYLILASQWANTAKVKASAFNNLGIISKRNGDYAKAVEYYINALKQYEIINEPKSQARTLGNLGSLYIQKKDYIKAQNVYEEAYHIAININFNEGIIQSLSGLGLTTKHFGNKQKAIDYFTQAAEMCMQRGKMIDYAQQVLNLADLHSDLKNYQLAETEYLKAEKIFLVDKVYFNLSVVYNNIADLYIAQHKNKKAIIYLEKAYELSKTYKNLNYNVLIVKNLSNMYESVGDTKKALAFRKKYEELNSEIVNVAENVKYVELNQKFETSKKEKQILQKDQQITQMQSSRKNIYIALGGLVIIVFLVLFLYRNRIKKQHILEGNIISIDKQIASLKIENTDLKSKLVLTELELQNIENKYSKNKEKLPNNLVNLSKREYEVLLFIAEGLSDKEVADKIFVSVTTVRTHIRRIYDKLLVKNRTEAVALLSRYNLLAEAT